MRKPRQEMDLFSAAVEVLKSGFMSDTKVSHAVVFTGSDNLLDHNRSKSR